MREPAVRKTLYWCEKCNVPLLGRRCACGAEGKAIPLLRPYDARPALAADRGIITGLLRQHFGTESLPRVVILNKTSGRDRNDLIIANGDRFGWLSFDPSSRKYSLELEFGAVPWLLASATRGVIDLTSVGGAYRDVTQGKRIGGKKYPAPVDLPEGPVLMTWEGHAAVGTCRAGSVKVREAGRYIPATYPDPGWDRVISSSISTLKNLERSAIRFIRHHAGRASCVAVSFSGGKDSTVTMELARRAGYGNAFFVDTGMEFPETLGFVRSLGIENILHAKDFWREIEKNGPPHKGRPLVLRTPETRSCQGMAEREGRVHHGPGQQVVRVLRPVRAPPGREEPLLPPPGQHIPDTELEGARGIPVYLVEKDSPEPPLRDGLREGGVLDVPSDARERMGTCPSHPSRPVRNMDGVPGGMGQEERDG